MSAAGGGQELVSGSRRDGRAPNQLRDIELRLGFVPHAEGSALLRWGGTTVLATVTLDARLPAHLRTAPHKGGWLTAEYAMVPRATQERTQRERLHPGGRTLEIQRLIGRALRSTVDLTMFKGKTIIVDVDVLIADGGTRCAGIVAGYAALHQAADRLVFKGDLGEWPLRHEVGAVSVGVMGGDVLLDLDFAEDTRVEADLNVVATAAGDVVEVQGAGEGGPVPAESYVALVATGIEGVKRVLDLLRPQLAGAR